MGRQSRKGINCMHSLIHQTIQIGNGLIHTGRSQLLLRLRIQEHAERVRYNHRRHGQVRIHTLHGIQQRSMASYRFFTKIVQLIRLFPVQIETADRLPL